MNIRTTLLFIGIALTVTAMLLGHPCLVFALEELLKLAVSALPSVVGA